MQGWSESFLQSITRQNKHTVYESWYRRGAQHAFTERQLKLFEKKPVHHVLHGTHFCQTMLLSQHLFFNYRQGQFSVWKQCLSTSRFSSTSSNWQLRPHKHFFSSLAQQILHTVPHILIDHDEHDVSRAPVLSLLPSHIARFHLKPFHFTCSFLIQVWASRHSHSFHAKICIAKLHCRFGPFYFRLCSTTRVACVAAPSAWTDGGCCICTSLS